MKRLLITLSVVFLSLNFVACSQKKDSKTRLTKGSGRQSGVYNAQEAYSWDYLNQYSIATELESSNPDLEARRFINNDPLFRGIVELNAVVMRLKFTNGRINSNETMLGLKFYDDWNDPLVYLLGSSTNRAAVSGDIRGNVVTVAFEDRTEDGASLGQVVVSGTIDGSYFNGKVTHAGGILGSFRVPVNSSIFY